jgi:hypothetical protein
MGEAQGCDIMTFLLILHSLHAILFVGVLLLMDVNVTVRGAEFTVESMSFVMVIPPFPVGNKAGPCRHRTAGPVKATSLAELNTARVTTPSHRRGRHMMGYTAVKEWSYDDAY